MILSLDGIVRSATLFNVVCDGLNLLHQVFYQREPLTRQQQVLFISDSTRFLLDSVSAYLNIDALSQNLLGKNQDILSRMEKVSKECAEGAWLQAQLTANMSRYQENYRKLSYLEMSASVTDIGHYFVSKEPQNTRFALVMNLWTRVSRLLNLESRVNSDLQLRSNVFLNKLYIISMTINRVVKYGLKAYQFVIANHLEIKDVVNRARDWWAQDRG